MGYQGIKKVRIFVDALLFGGVFRDDCVVFGNACGGCIFRHT